MPNPLQIIIDILVYLVRDTWEDIQFVAGKTGELFLSLIEISSQNFLGLIIASIFGGVAIYFIMKYLFGTTKFFIVVLIAFIISVIFALGLLA